MVKLYALKCRGGYVRSSGEEGCQCVPFNKASVYNDPDSLEEITRLAEKEGINGIKRVELTIMEREYTP